MFASLIHAEDRSPFGDFWYQPVGNRSVAGVMVTPDSAMRVSAVFACVREHARFAMLPVRFVEPVGRKKKVVTNHPLYKVLSRRPNRWQNGFVWREMLQVHLALRGNAYNFISANSRGVIKELIPLHPDRVKPKVKPDGDYNYEYTDQNGKVTIYAREEIWHIKGMGADIYRGYNPIELARNSIGTALAAQEYGARFFANDAKPSGGWIEHPGTFKDAEAKKRFRESWQGMQSGNNRGKTAVLEGGMKYHEIGLNNADAQFIETNKFGVEDIARWFDVPPHRIGHLERSTNNNIEHQGLELVIYMYNNIAERWESHIESDLFFDDEGIEVEFDFSRLLRGDSKTRSMYYHNGILDGWLTRNEAREMENRNPLDGLDEPLRPLNMLPESEADEEEEEMEGEKEGDDKPKEDENE